MIKVNFRLVPVLLLGLILGIFVAVCNNLVVQVLFMLAFFILLILTFTHDKFNKKKFAIICLCVAICLGSILSLVNNYNLSKNQFSFEDTIISGQITAESTRDSAGNVLGEYVLKNVRLENGKVLKGVVFVKGNKIDAKVGDFVTISGDLEKVENDPFNSFSMNKFKNNVYHEFASKNNISITKGKMNFLDGLKIKLHSNLEKFMPKSAGFTYAMLLGDKDFIAQDVKDQFSKVGTAHIFSVSGLHIGILSASILWLLKRFKTKKITNLIVVSLFCFAYALLCNFSPSVMRASIMIILFLIAEIIGRNKDSVSVVSLACVLILLFKPLYLFETSFLLSFSAVFGLVFFQRPICEFLSKKLPLKLSKLTAQSLAVVFMGLPFLISFFGRVNLVFILGNLLLLPIVTLIFPFLFLASIISFIPYFGVVLIPFDLVLQGVVFVNGILSNVSILKISFDTNFYFICIYFILVTFLSRFVMVKKSPKVFVGVMVGMLLVANIAFATISKTFFNKTFVATYNEYTNTNFVFTRQGDENILFVNGNISEYDKYLCRKVMKEFDISKIDYLVKHKVTLGEVEPVNELASYINIKHTVVKEFSDETVLIENIYPKNSLVLNGGLVYFKGNSIVFNDGISTVIFNNGYEEVVDDYESSIGFFRQDVVNNSQIVVKDGVYFDKEKYINKSNFTFNFKSGKISKIRFWKL